MKAVVATFNQEKALVGAFSVIMNLRVDLRLKLFLLHVLRPPPPDGGAASAPPSRLSARGAGGGGRPRGGGGEEGGQEAVQGHPAPGLPGARWVPRRRLRGDGDCVAASGVPRPGHACRRNITSNPLWKFALKL